MRTRSRTPIGSRIFADRHRGHRPICLNVRLNLEPVTFFRFGIECSQKCCSCPFITSKVPCLRGTTILTRLSSFLRIMKSRVSPKFTEAMVGFFPNSFSSSECQFRWSLPSRYQLSKTLLKVIPENLSISFLIYKRPLFQSFGREVIPEYVYVFPLSPYQDVSL